MKTGDTTEIEAHYETLLAARYTWMSGGAFDDAVAAQTALLREAGVGDAAGVAAVDLGAGSGFQTVALARMGFHVTAIDLSASLLAELSSRALGLAVTTIRADLARAGEHVPASSAAVVTCMGDTLTHLPDRAAVSRALRACATVLAPGGRLVATYRDLSGSPLQGTDRFIFIRGDARRVMTCFLEDAGEEAVVVHDIIHERDDQGRWQMQAGAYRKLRLAAGWLTAEVVAAGLKVERVTPGRLTTLVAVKV